MARIPDDVIQTVRSSVDLAELVGRYVQLKKTGKSYKGCCPFHQEKTPSFHVVADKDFWHCFGCGKTGDCFKFLTEREGMPFVDAVRQLAREHAIALPDDGDDAEAAAQAARIGRLRQAMEWACLEFEKALWSPLGERGRAYLKRRGLVKDTVRTFRLGYAPDGWQHLTDAARRDGLAEDDLAELGLVRRKEPEEGRPGRTYDFFRDRVTFPIADTQGRVIAFGARTLGDDEPKYLNSPETPLFSKGRTVYALHLAKHAMMSKGDGAVMEGYTDVIMAHQCGWPVAVAGLGTALTREQAALVARHAKRIYLVYDGDAAGAKAALRNAPTFLPEESETRVAVLPPGEDPCDTLLRAGLPALRACLDKSREAFDHVLAAQALVHDVASVPGKAQALDAALEALVPVANEVRRALYVKRAADAFQVPEEIAAARLRELRAREVRAERRTPVAAASAASGPRDAPAAAIPAGTGEPAPATAAPVPQKPRPAGPPPAVEEQFVEALLGRPELAAEAAERLPADALTHAACRELARRLVDRQEETGTAPDVGLVVAAIEDPALASFAAALIVRGAGKDLLRQGRDCLARIATQHEAQRLGASLAGLGAGASPASGELAPDEGEMLRRWVEFHRRRSSGQG